MSFTSHSKHFPVNDGLTLVFFKHYSCLQAHSTNNGSDSTQKHYTETWNSKSLWHFHTWMIGKNTGLQDTKHSDMFTTLYTQRFYSFLPTRLSSTYAIKNINFMHTSTHIELENFEYTFLLI